MNDHNILIVGAGPAGLTAAYELQKAGIKNITIVESDEQVGGISKTVAYNGNRIDIGGHRFFSKSNWVMNWWSEILPLAKSDAHGEIALRYKGQLRVDTSMRTSEEVADDHANVMRVRSRLSRIYFNKRFFDYPLKLNLGNLQKLGVYKTVTFGVSYVASKLRPIKEEKSLQDFFQNRFGDRLYRQFFKEYTEKVWGVPCSEISAEWGAQRVKSLSVGSAIWHAAKSALGFGDKAAAQTSLIESFIYPNLGPGQMWEEVARRFVANGGTLLTRHTVSGIRISQDVARSVEVVGVDNVRRELNCTHLISTMPVRDLVNASREAWSEKVVDVASRLEYRDFITVGVLYDRKDFPVELADNWIYIQEPGVKVGRVQVFNNWSPAMVADPDKIWLGLEFFCNETDALWTMPDHELKALAQREMLEIGLVNARQALDAMVLRVPKAYPGYFGEAYQAFDVVRAELDRVDNLFLIGRNGMHRYNNQDHSMLTAKEAVDQIVSGKVDKSRIWAINVDDEYHEEASTREQEKPGRSEGAVGAGALPLGSAGQVGA